MAEINLGHLHAHGRQQHLPHRGARQVAHLPVRRLTKALEESKEETFSVQCTYISLVRDAAL